MVRGGRKQSEGNVYHVTSRGVGKQIIFEDANDKKCFVELLTEQLNNHKVELWAWCLMNNHFHLLLHAPIEDVSALLHHVHSVYARYFNKRHEREGSLFQGRFYSVPIQNDEQLCAVVRYIHYNPVKAGGHLRSPWSSYKEYLGEAGPCVIKKPLSIMGGAKGFADLHTSDAAVTPVRLPHGQVSDEDMVEVACKALGKINIHDIKSFEKEKRNNVLCILKNTGLSVRQISLLTGIGHNIISRA